MTLEDFTTYTEVDTANNRIQRTHHHVDHAATRNESTYLYKDYGVEHFSDFKHYVAVRSDFAAVNGRGTVWMVANDVDDVLRLSSEGKTFLQIRLYRTDTQRVLAFYEWVAGFGIGDGKLDMLPDTWYYLVIEKIGTSLTVKIYGDAARTNLLKTLNITLRGDWKFRYIYACNTYHYGTVPYLINNDIENLDLEPPPPPETRTLTIKSMDGGTTYPLPDSYSYEKDSPHEVTAIPDNGYVFDHWELDGKVSKKLSYNVTMDKDYTLRAFFVPSKVGTLNLLALADTEEVTASVLVTSETGVTLDPYETGQEIKLAPGTYTLSANYKGQTKTDAETIKAGVTSTVTFRFTKWYALTIVSDPSHINFTFNTESKKTPFVDQEVATGTYTIVFPASWMVGVDEYLFTQWEDGSVDPTRILIVGSPQQYNLTATYRLKQIEGTGPITQREHKDNLRQVFGKEKDIDEDNPLPVDVTNKLLAVEDTGVHSNPERYRQDNHWDSGAELVLNAAAAVNLGVAVAAGATRRIRSITVRNVAQANTIITLSQVAPAQNRVSFDVLAQSTRVWSEQDGVEFLTGVQVQISHLGHENPEVPL
ncbi:unnamed protein product [marine sediment metagenome]|uniref:Bacterial repeat domain-containing protein n=1 Tax=marine sediment metagenome TaxID=412755 RepID=X1KIT0_9ZZZZ